MFYAKVFDLIFKLVIQFFVLFQGKMKKKWLLALLRHQLNQTINSTSKNVIQYFVRKMLIL